jgi:hypothetical protein
MPIRLQDIPEIGEGVESFCLEVTFREEKDVIITDNFYLIQKSMETLPDQITFYSRIVNGEYSDPFPLSLIEIISLEPAKYIRWK